MNCVYFQATLSIPLLYIVVIKEKVFLICHFE
jgi:hypothetical protein